jgi:hypothetical protein
MIGSKSLLGAGALALVGTASVAYFTPVRPCNCDGTMTAEESSVPGDSVPAKPSPVACLLSEAELRERQKNVLAKMMARVLETKALDSGYAFRFAVDDTILAELVAVIQAERKCCAFLKFKLDVSPDNGPVWFEITGPKGTKDLLRKALELTV